MKEFRTELPITPSVNRMKLQNGILTQGSCFSDAIGQRLAGHKVKSMINPFGVIYNPESIHRVLTCAVFNEPLPEHTYLQNHDVHFNFNLHSEFSALKKTLLSSRLTAAIGHAHYFLKDAEWLLMTYGTAWVYRRNDTGEVVANCHKMPASFFDRSLMKAEEILSSFSAFYHALKKFNPRIKIILTVSPVRHLKETLTGNSVSKSLLRVACNLIETQYNDVDYFPAYELMMDDLRDYRFYKPDMLHPTDQAEDYIWEKFLERYADEQLSDFINQWKPILSAMNHRPFHPGSESHQRFLRKTLEKIEELKSLVNVEEEVSRIKKQML